MRPSPLTLATSAESARRSAPAPGPDPDEFPRLVAPLPAVERPGAVRALLGLFGSTVSCWFSSGTGELASAIAFQVQLSLAPFLLLLMSGASRLLGSSAARQALLDVVRTFASESAIPSVESVVDGVVSARGGVLVTLVGIVTMGYFASGAMLQIRSAMNRVWGTQSSLRGALYERVVSIVLVPAALLVILITMFLGFVGAIVLPLVTGWFPSAAQLWSAIGSLLSLGLLAMLLGFVFRYGANARLRWGDVAPGAAITAVLFTLGNTLIGRLVGRSLLVPLYGPAGALLAVLLWVYYGAQILLFGACFTRAWAERHGSRAKALVVH